MEIPFSKKIMFKATLPLIKLFLLKKKKKEIKNCKRRSRKKNSHLLITNKFGSLKLENKIIYN
jgi:hypothetical protein